MCGLGFPLLVLSNHIDLIVSIPVQALERDVVVVGSEPEFRLPFRRMLLQECDKGKGKGKAAEGGMGIWGLEKPARPKNTTSKEIQGTSLLPTLSPTARTARRVAETRLLYGGSMN